MGYDSTEKTTSINSEIQKVKSDIDRLANNGDVSGLMKYSVDNDSSINIVHKTMLKAIAAQYKQAKMLTAADNVIKNKFKETGEKVVMNDDFISFALQTNCTRQKMLLNLKNEKFSHKELDFFLSKIQKLVENELLLIS